MIGKGVCHLLSQMPKMQKGRGHIDDREALGVMHSHAQSFDAQEAA